MAIPTTPRMLKISAEVSTEVARTNTKLRAYLKAVGRNTPQGLLAFGFEFQAAVQLKTPVRTGRAKNSWHTIPPGTAADAYQYRDNHGNTFNGSLLDGATGPMEIKVGSNVEYMLPLEGGHSKQTPGGMVRVTLREMRRGMAQQITARKGTP